MRLITHLGSSRRESSFMTWAYRVAANYLATARRSRLEEPNYTFQQFGQELAEGLADTQPITNVEESLLREEVRIGRTIGMLQCLDRANRLTFILGNILELDYKEASVVSRDRACDVS